MVLTPESQVALDALAAHQREQRQRIADEQSAFWLRRAATWRAQGRLDQVALCHQRAARAQERV